MSTYHAEGPAFVIDGDVAADEILHPRHHGNANIGDVAGHCFADQHGGAVPFSARTWTFVIATGRFGVGIVRPPVPAAMKAAGIAAVIAPSISPLFVEHSVNGGAVLPLRASLPQRPETGAIVRLSIANGRANLFWNGHELACDCNLPGWALAGETWIDVLKRRGAAAHA
jgi:3-isopropylmalate dehydratase small subunit